MSDVTSGGNLVASLVASNALNDREQALVYKAAVRTHLEALCATMDEANRKGMRLTFQVGMDGYGRNIVAALDVVKVL